MIRAKKPVWAFRRRRRAGYTLVYFAMFFFAILGIAALLIDVGLARTSRLRMQSAVNSAALEGLRFRDDPAVPEADRDRRRRERAAEFGTRMSEDGKGWELNLSNAPHGDLVSGASLEDDRHEESADYLRTDFLPAFGGDAFLARLRRTNDDEGLDEQAGVSHRSETAEYRFGRAVLWEADARPSGQAARDRGITLRATAIAKARPALAVGNSRNSLDPNWRGLVPLTLELAYWNALTTDVNDDQTMTEGQIGAFGRFFAVAAPELSPIVVGRELPAAQSPASGVFEGYVPLYSAIDDGEAVRNRVVGFGSIRATVDTNGTVGLTRLSSQIGVNASALLVYSPRISVEGFRSALAVGRSIEEPLLAPTLAR